MRILFLQDNGINESLLLTEVSAVLKHAGHTTEMLIHREERRFERAVRATNPDLVMIPAQIRGHEWVLRTCRALDRWLPGVPRVLAGSHVTFFPDILERDEVDMIILGEAEYATLDLLDALAGKRPLSSVQNLWYRRGKTIHRSELRPLVQELDSLPLPDRGLYFDRYRFLSDFPWKKFTSGRGCLHHCSYCYQPLYRAMCAGKGTYVRRKSPERVAREVASVARRHPLTNAHFSDDLFITSPRWMERFAEIYPHEAGVPYTVNSSAEFVTEQTARLLAESGCRAVAIGIETGNEALRQEILAKRLRDDDIRQAARLIRDHGMTLVTFNMLASPRETVQDALSTLRLNAELGTDHARVTICFPIPGTRMAEDALAAGQLLEGSGRDIYEPRPGRGDAMGVYFQSALPHRDQFLNLKDLFSLGVSYQALIPVIERLARLPHNPIVSLANFHALLLEKRVFRFSLFQGICYFRHAGWPSDRTANFVSLV